MCVLIRAAPALASVSTLGGLVFLLVTGSYSLEKLETDKRTHTHTLFAVYKKKKKGELCNVEYLYVFMQNNQKLNRIVSLIVSESM